MSTCRLLFTESRQRHASRDIFFLNLFACQSQFSSCKFIFYSWTQNCCLHFVYSEYDPSRFFLLYFCYTLRPKSTLIHHLLQFIAHICSGNKFAMKRASQSDILSSWNGEFSSEIRVSITNQFPERQNQFGFLVVCCQLILIIQYSLM